MPTTIVSFFELADYRGQGGDAGKMLRDGKLVVLPTETVYGAAGLLTNPAALQQLKALRGNDGDKPFTIHLAKCEDATKYLGPVSDLAKRMMTKLWPGPVAIQFDVPAERRQEVARKLEVAESELYEDGTITLRCPDHMITSDVLAA